MRILLNMNTSLVTALQEFVATSKVLFDVSQYQNWNSIGATATRETITTLGRLLQRILQNAPIERSLSARVSELGTDSNREVVTYYNNGGKYEGQLNRNGRRHGFGKYVFGGGDTYVGEWEEGERSGYGKETFPAKELLPGKIQPTQYEGTFQDGKWHGYGKCICTNGSEYVGEWDSNKMHGYGKMFHLEGAYYQGQWNRGKYHGNGIMSWSPSAKYEGEWVFGKMRGYGTRTWEDGIVYEGEFRDGKPHGRGVQTYPWGEKYDGYFVDGLRHGYAKFTKRSGKIIEAMWKDNEIEGIFND